MSVNEARQQDREARSGTAPPGRSVSAPLSGRGATLAGTLALLVAAIEVFFDWSTPIEINVSIVYALPLVLAAATRSPRFLWGLTLFLVLTVFAVFDVQTPPGIFSPHERFFVDRELSAITLLFMAGMLHIAMLGIDAIDEQRRLLNEQNAQLERRRREAEDGSDRKTRLLASVSHDIRSPVNAIGLMADIIRLSSGDPDQAARIPHLAERLQANARSLADLVSDILDLSSFGSGRIRLRDSELVLDELLHEVCSRLLPLAEAKALHLVCEPMAQRIRLRTDKVALTRILDNLVSNAIKFTDRGGVSVAAELGPERAISIRVRDSGIGIAPESLASVFDEYARLSDVNRDHAKGWGLGLPICRRLAEALGGEIALESELHRGSVFTVRLPAACLVADA